MQYEADALRILTSGIDLDPQLAVCRRLVQESCPYKGTRPLTLVDLLPTIRLAPTVIVSVGYNDPESTFGDSVGTALDALEKAGAERVLWLTLREERQSYANMNDVLRAAVATHPEVTIVDWNMYSRSHPDWFQDDGLHLGYAGAVGMATLIHKKLVEAGVVQAPAPAGLAIATTKLPAARVGRPYLAQLRATGGTKPVRWTRLTGIAPRRPAAARRRSRHRHAAHFGHEDGHRPRDGRRRPARLAAVRPRRARELRPVGCPRCRPP